MDKFTRFLTEIAYHDSILVESIVDAYSVIFEGVSINKDYLLKLAKNNIDILKQAKSNGIILTDKLLPVLPNGKSNTLYIPLSNFFTMLLLKGETINEDVVGYIHDLFVDGNTSSVEKIAKNSDITVNELINAYTSYKETKSKTNVSGDESKEFSNVEVVKEFNDGWKWIIPLTSEGQRKGACSVEAKVAHHCGNVPSLQTGDTLYSLRNGNKIAATVIVNDNGNIRESKGNYNAKIDKNYRNHMLWLFRHEHIKGIDDTGSYAPDRNTHLSDFLGDDNEEEIHQLKEEKPSLMSDTYDKTVFDLKKKYQQGQISDETLYDMLDDRKIKLYHLKGITGRTPPTNYIEMAGIPLIDVAQTDIKLLTPEIQNYFLMMSGSRNLKTLLDVESQVSSFKVDRDVINKNLEYGNFGYGTLLKIASSLGINDLVKMGLHDTTSEASINSAFKYAASANKLDTVKLIYDNAKVDNQDIFEVMSHIIQQNHIEMYDYIRSNMPEHGNKFTFEQLDRLFEESVYFGNLYILKDIAKSLPKISHGTLSYSLTQSVKLKHIDVLKFLLTYKPSLASNELESVMFSANNIQEPNIKKEILGILYNARATGILTIDKELDTKMDELYNTDSIDEYLNKK